MEQVRSEKVQMEHLISYRTHSGKIALFVLVYILINIHYATTNKPNPNCERSLVRVNQHLQQVLNILEIKAFSSTMIHMSEKNIVSVSS